MAQAVSGSPASLARRDLSARQAVVLACAATAVVLVLDLRDDALGPLFSVGFVLISVTMPLAVDVRSLFTSGVLPPVLMIGSILLVAMFSPDAIQVDGMSQDAGTVGRLIAGVIDRGLTLVIGHGVAIALIVWRILSAPDR